MIKIEFIDINDIVTYVNNAKRHPAEQIEQIKKSIEEFGFNDPIAIWKNNVIIEGHGRLLAAKELGFEKVPIIRLDNLTDEQRRAYALIHNQLTLNSGFDYDFLVEELEKINDYPMTEYGFDDYSEFDIDEYYEVDDKKSGKKITCKMCGFEFYVDEKGNILK